MGWVQLVFIFLRSLVRCRAELAAENLALRQQLAILKEKIETGCSGFGSRNSGRIGDPRSSSSNQPPWSVGIAEDSNSIGVGNRDRRNLVVPKFGVRLEISYGECVERIQLGALREFTPNCVYLAMMYRKRRWANT